MSAKKLPVLILAGTFAGSAISASGSGMSYHAHRAQMPLVAQGAKPAMQPGMSIANVLSAASLAVAVAGSSPQIVANVTAAATSVAGAVAQAVSSVADVVEEASPAMQELADAATPMAGGGYDGADDSGCGGSSGDLSGIGNEPVMPDPDRALVKAAPAAPLAHAGSVVPR